MATKFQIKRTSVSGRTPNTTNSANSSYIAAGELALNLTDKKMYSSNGTNYFEIGAFKVELVNSTSNVSTFTEISTLQFDEDSGFDVTNPSAGVAKVAMNSTFKFWQVNGTTQLTATGLDTVNFISGDNITITANGANTPQSIAFSTSLTPTFTRITVGNSTVNTVANSTSITTKQIYANGAFGTTGQVLTSNGSGMYWSDKVDSTFTISSETFTANGTATQFTLSQPTTSLETFVFLNGVAQIPTTDYSISNVTLTFVAPPANNDEVEVRIIDIPQINGVDIKLDSFVGNGSNTVYTLSTSLSTNTTTFVYLNGVAQVPSVDYSVSGSTLTFTTAPVNLELIRAVTINPVGNYASDSFTANSTVNNNFTLSIPTVTNRALVFINGVAQAPSIDYYVTGSTLKLTNNAAANDVIQVRSFFDEPSGSGANTTIQYNFSGRLKGSSGFTFDETTNNVTVGNTLVVPNLIVSASNPPSNSTSTGTTGTFTWDSSYFYIATGTNTWKKVPITTDGVVGSAVTAGSNTEIQFNSSGALGANSNFRFDSAATLLTVGNGTVNTTVNSSAVTATKIIANGAFGSNGQVLTSNGTAMYWGTGGGGAGSGVGITRESFTGNGSNTVFTLSTQPIDETHLMVYVDRVIQRDPDYTVSGTTLTFATAPDNGADIDAYIMTSANQQHRGVKTNVFTGNGTNTQFTLAATSSNSSYTLVYVDSLFQPTSEYTVSGTTLTFNSPPDNGVNIDVIQLGIGLVGDPQAAGANNEIQYHSSNGFGANNKFTFNPSTSTLAIGSNVTVNTSAIFIGNSTVNTTIIAGNITLQGTQLQVGNVIVNGNQLVVGNVTITDTQISVGNSTVNTVLGQTGSLSGNGALLTSVNAIALQGNSVSDILVAANTAANILASAAYSNAIAFSGNAAQAFSNATAYADTKAGQAYSNAIAYSGNAVQAYTNAISYADTKAGDAYNNAVSYAASNTYVNNTFLPLSGGTLSGALVVNASANIVGNLAANNVTFRGDVQIDGNLTVTGTSVTLNVASLAVEDNMIYLNNGSQVTDPDLGITGNYNDGTYRHAGFFRDATDGVWKVFDGYLPEPDASAFIDTSNASFRIADFQANGITAANVSLTGTLTVKAISANSSLGTAGQLLASNGTSSYWIDPPASTNVDAQYTWTNNHTFNSQITISNTLVVTRISANGSLGTAGKVLSSNSTGGLYWGTGGTSVTRNAYTGNGSNTVFTLGASSSNSSFTLVYVDSVFQPTTEYSVDGTTITFTSPPDNGIPIEVIQLGTSITDTTTVTGSNTQIQFNDSGSLGANSLLTFNKASNTLTVGNSTVNTAIRPNGATFSGDLMPSANVTYDLGNSAMRWRDLWLSGTTINLGGASIKTDTDTGAIALIPKPTIANPDPVAMVVSPTGGITSVPTTGGVPAANAVAAAAESNTAAPVPIDITSTAPANGQALIWNSTASTFVPSNVTGLRNRLINGSMLIDQRNSGASQTITAAAALAYTVDRWYAYCTGANVTGQRVAGANANLYRYQFTGAASVSAIGFGQRIESMHSADLAGTTATLSVDLSNSLLTTVAWAAYYANTTNTFGTLASPTRTLISSGTFTVTSTVTRYATQISVPPEAVTGIEIVFSVGGQTSGTWIIGDVQLESGAVATPIERRFIGQELLLCQRYYEVKTAYSVAKGGQYDANGWIFVPQYMTKRVVPTITCSASFSNPTNRRTTTAAVMTSSSALDGATVFIDAEMKD